MKITLRSTSSVVDIYAPDSGKSIQCRVWEGTTERGTKVQALIVRLASPSAENQSEMEEDLKAAAPPAEPPAFPIRMIL